MLFPLASYHFLPLRTKYSQHSVLKRLVHALPIMRHTKFHTRKKQLVKLYFILNKNRTVDNVQKHNIYILFTNF
jgi:hypothetical protein